MRELLTSSGSNFRDPQVNFYRSTQSKDPQEIARAVALTFMGTRADKWPPEKLASMAKFFSYIGYKRTAEWKEEIVYFDFQKLLEEGPQTAALSRRNDGRIDGGQGSTRGVCRLADYEPRTPGLLVTSSTEPGSGCWGAASSTSRTISATTIRPATRNCSPYLEKELTSSHYDMKELFREILNSKTYQLSSIPQVGGSEGGGAVCLLPVAAVGRRSAGGCPLPDHGDDRGVFESHPGAVYVRARTPAFDRAGGRQHHQHVSGDVWPSAA